MINYIFSGALTPSKSKALLITCAVANESVALAEFKSELFSSPIGRTRQSL
jgi:hypothetical protein